MTALITGAVCHQAVAGVSYQITDLGALVDLGDRTDSRPYGINATGQIAMTNVTEGRYRALHYDGTFLDLGTLGGNEALAFNINNAGQLVGRSFTSDGKTRAFLWTPSGTDGVAGNPQMRNLGTLGSGDHSEAFSINASGQVVGYSDTTLLPATNRQHAFLYANGTMEDLGGLMGFPNSFAYSINTAGRVTGTAFNPFYTISKGFFYNGQQMTDIGSLGGVSTNAIAINDSDRIVGWSEVIAGPEISFDRAFLYDGQTMKDLGTLGGNYSYALGINSQNDIVGGAFVDMDDTVFHAFIYAGGMMKDLNTLAGALAQGWVLEEARAINDSGQIVGVGIRNDQPHGFLLTPTTTPPPTPGDVNLDGKVDRADVALLIANFGTTGGASWSQGNFNNDGNVSLIDLELQQSHFTAAASPTVVPEPPMNLLAVLIVIAALSRPGIWFGSGRQTTSAQ